VVGCSKNDQPDSSQRAKSVEPDPTRLPAALRKRLEEAKQRIKTLETQREILSAKLDKLIAMNNNYQASDDIASKARQEAQALIAQTERQLKLVEDALKRLNDLVERVKLQAVADEAQVDPISSDKELTSALQDAVDVYGELGELESVQREAALGQVDAQFKLAQRYEKGEGVDESDVEALQWYTKAAGQGHVEAALIAGFFYKHGRGTPRDISQAIKWYTQAAEAGNLTAASNLGRVLGTPPRKTGKTTDAASESASNEQKQSRAPRNLSEAIRWYQVAAEGGVSSAQMRLAQLYISSQSDAQLGKHAPQGLLDRYAEARRLLIRASKSKRAKVKAKAQTLLKKFPSVYAPRMLNEVKSSFHWITLNAGEFQMGDPEQHQDAKPRRTVKLPQFVLSSSEVTATQYKHCVQAGVCSKPELDKQGCNIRKSSRGDHPINCISWSQARVFARWVGGDLPSEAQWEFAARSGGQYTRYPWGDDPATCERVVMHDVKKKAGGSKEQKRRKRNDRRRSRKKRGTQKESRAKGCGRGHTWSVCSKPQGLSAQGLCDLVGNLWEWTLDEYRPSYDGAPSDGTARCIKPGCEGVDRVARVIRGGAYMTRSSGATATKRSQSNRPAIGIGFRVALSSPPQK